MTPDQVQKIILSKWPHAIAQVQDLTGTQDHYQVLVVTKDFEGKKMIEQHRMVKSVFDAYIQSGEVHALSLKTYTPQEWEKYNGGNNGR